MTAPTKLKMRFTDADEKPVVNLPVAYYLQQTMLNGRSYAFGAAPQSLRQLAMNPATKRLPIVDRMQINRQPRKAVRTNQDGMAELTGVPLNSNVLMMWRRENDGVSNTRMHVVKAPNETIEISFAK